MDSCEECVRGWCVDGTGGFISTKPSRERERGMRMMVNLFGYRRRSMALQEQRVVGSAVSGETAVLAASDKMLLKESGTIPV